MKALGSLASLAALAILLTVGAFAANKNEGNFTLTDTVRVGSTDLQPGDYKAQWTDQGSGNVKVDILQHGKVVATTSGKLKDLQGRSPYSAVITKPLSDNANARTIDEIDFSNRKQALTIGE